MHDSCKQEQSSENIWKGYFNNNISNNSPSNIFLKSFLIQELSS